MLEDDRPFFPSFSGAALGVLFTAAVLLCGARPAAAQCDFVVDPAGGGDFTTIQEAVDALPASGPCSILIQPGSYSEHVQIDGVTGPLSVRGAEGPAEAPLTVQIVPGKARGLSITGSSQVSVGLVRVTGGNDGAKAEPVYVKNSSDVTLFRCEVTQNGGGSDAAGLRIDSGNARLRVENCLFRNNEKTPIQIREGEDIHLVHNTIWGNNGDGVEVDGGTVVLQGNAIAFNGMSETGKGFFGVRLPRGGGSVTLADNVLYGNGIPKGADLSEAIPSGSGNLTTFGDEGAGVAGCVFPGAGCPADTPEGLFLDPGRLDGSGFPDPDLHPAAGSPLVDAASGAPLSPPAVDLEGKARDAQPDAGAYEVSKDLDEDGIADPEDNCPPVPGQQGNLTYNPEQTDSDGDGVGDKCDNCAFDANPPTADTNGDGVIGAGDAQTDTDGDGRGDACDFQVHISSVNLFNEPDDVNAILSFLALEDTQTLFPSCTARTYSCERLSCGTGSSPECQPGLVLNRKYNDSAAQGIFDVVFIPAGTQISELCSIDEQFSAGAFEPGDYQCEFCYANHFQTDVSCGTEGGTCDFNGVECDVTQFTVHAAGEFDTGSCSPGFYKNNTGQWPPGYSPEDDADAAFQCSDFGQPAPGFSSTLLEALGANGGGIDALARHGVAALLNSAQDPLNYPLSTEDVRKLVCSGAAIDPDGTADLLAALNTGCPLSANP